MSAPLTSSNALGADVRALNTLRLQAGQATPAAIRETAKQFEALFMQELIKSMREATMKSGLTDGGSSDLGTQLLDQQLALQMSGRPGGLSDLIARQLSRQMGVSESTASASLQAGGSLRPYTVGNDPPMASPMGTAVANNPAPSASQSGFVQRHAAAAARVSQVSGLPSAYMLGQAGHETGWGRHEIKLSDGSPSYNLFGIKATPGWAGKVAEVTTTEYVNGVAQKVVAKFRAYDSYEDSFRDYARLITQSPRYQQASLQTGSAQAFATGLQRAGYATDPQYAAKLSRAINSTLRMQRVQA